MTGSLKGAVLAESIVLLYAIFFFFYFGLGPVPRDFHSSWEFARSVASTILLLGTLVALPIGVAIGTLATRVRRHRRAKLVLAAAAGSLAAPFVVSRVFGGGELFSLSMPGAVLALLAALVLEQWTRRPE